MNLLLTSQACIFAAPARPLFCILLRTIGVASSTTEEHPTCLGGGPFASEWRVVGDGGGGEWRGRGIQEGEGSSRGGGGGGPSGPSGPKGPMERGKRLRETQNMTSHKVTKIKKNDVTRSRRLTHNDVTGLHICWSCASAILLLTEGLHRGVHDAGCCSGSILHFSNHP